MIDTGEIRRAIEELESRETTFSTCSKLADLYTVLDHAEPAPDYDRSYSRAAAPIAKETAEIYGSSDFLHAVAGKDPAAAWKVMDELMDTLKVVNGRVYESVMRKIKGLA